MRVGQLVDGAGREYYGNTTRIHYQVGARPVARCPRCAQVHGYIRNAGSIAFWTLSTSVLLFALLKPGTWFASVSTGVGAVLVALGILAASGIGFMARACPKRGGGRVAGVCCVQSLRREVVDHGADARTAMREERVADEAAGSRLLFSDVHRENECTALLGEHGLGCLSVSELSPAMGITAGLDHAAGLVDHAMKKTASKTRPAWSEAGPRR